MSRTFTVLLWALALSLMMAAVGCGGGGDELTTPGNRTEPLPEDLAPEIQVQIVDHQFRVPGFSDEILSSDPIFSIIGAASSSLDIAVTRINRQEVVDALLNEAQAGTEIRIVTEKAYYEAPNYRPFYAQLEDPTLNLGNISIRTDNDNLPRLMHSRFLIVDHARVVTGSYNWETINSEKTFGDVITILNTGVAAAFTNQFNQMYNEGNFGVHKRNDTQHSFVVGSGNGLLEVYFGPTDQPRELLLTEVDRSANVFMAVQQFKDVVTANNMLGWIGNPENSLILLINNFGGEGDFASNAVYDAFLSLVEDEEAVAGALYLNDMMDYSGVFNGYNVMNHKLTMCDHARTDGQPVVVFTTANYNDVDLTQNDEIMLIMRYPSLVSKYWRGINLASTLPPDNVLAAQDFQEFDELFAMWPLLQNAAAPILRGFADVPCGIVFGEVDNFRQTVTISAGDGELEEVDIDLTFRLEGNLFFTGDPYGSPNRLVPYSEGDLFEESELANPDHRYMLVVPAGEGIIETIVTDPDGAPSLLFQPEETHFEIGPGCVKRLDLGINQAGQEGQPGTGGGSGGGGGGGGGVS